MYKKTLTFLFLFVMLVNCSLHHITVPQHMEEARTERYDFYGTKEGKEAKIILNKNWVTEWRPRTTEGSVCYEYAPASEFYKIIKHYHRNGMIKMRGKILGSARFGIWEYFDEDGNRTRVVNEDAKFGAIGPDEIIKILETEGWINRQNGKNKIYSFKTSLPVNGYFIRNLSPICGLFFVLL